jgi:hypothetical protein
VGYRAPGPQRRGDQRRLGQFLLGGACFLRLFGVDLDAVRALRRQCLIPAEYWDAVGQPFQADKDALFLSFRERGIILFVGVAMPRLGCGLAEELIEFAGWLDKEQAGCASRLVNEWADVLECLRVFRHAGFFRARGNSLLDPDRQCH